MKHLAFITLFITLNAFPSYPLVENTTIIKVGRRIPVIDQEERETTKAKHIEQRVECQYRLEQQDSSRILFREYHSRYDTLGDLTCEVNRHANFYDSTIYTYGKVGNMLTAREYNSERNYSLCDSFSYNNNGKLIDARYYDSNNKLERRENNKYDSLNKLIMNIVWDKDDSTKIDTTNYTYEYDAKGNVIKYYKNNILTDELTYNENNKVLVTKEFSGKDELLYRYNYSKADVLLSAEYTVIKKGTGVYHSFDRYNKGEQIIESISNDYEKKSKRSTENIYSDKNELLQTKVDEFKDDKLFSTLIFSYVREVDFRGNTIVFEEIKEKKSQFGSERIAHTRIEYYYQYFK